MAINRHQIYHFVKHFFNAKRKGHGIHSPFAYQLCEEVFYNHNAFYNLSELKKIRERLLHDETPLTVEDFGAGSKTFKSNTRKIKDIAAKGISSTQQSEILYKLINFLSCATTVELGTSLGLNTLYLAKGNPGGKVFTMEGSSALTDFARNLAEKNNTSNIQFIHAKFDEAFPALLKTLLPIDLLYADGNHTYRATLNYFNLALQKKHNDTVFIFDDIYWSKGMTEAWQKIQQHPEVTLSIDCFYFGMVFFREEIKEKVELKVYLPLRH